MPSFRRGTVTEIISEREGLQRVALGEERAYVLTHLTGPVACVSEAPAAMAMVALLVADGDADEALVVHVDLAVDAGGRDRAAAVLVTGPVAPQPPAASGRGGEETR